MHVLKSYFLVALTPFNLFWMLYIGYTVLEDEPMSAPQYYLPSDQVSMLAPCGHCLAWLPGVNVVGRSPPWEPALVSTYQFV